MFAYTSSERKIRPHCLYISADIVSKISYSFNSRNVIKKNTIRSTAYVNIGIIGSTSRYQIFINVKGLTSLQVMICHEKPELLVFACSVSKTKNVDK